MGASSLVWELRASWLDAAAARVGASVEPAVRLSGADTWVGPAADDARLALAAAVRTTGDAADALRRAAAACRARAAEEAGASR
jgi:hypothetical protein